jgi:hypothetical protein
VSGTAGALLGWLHADHQWAVEHAQVLAGIVSYPPDSPVALQHARLWSLIPQIGALMLRAGVSELALSKLVSAALGLVSLQAVAMTIYALGRDARIAVGGALVVAAARAVEFGVVYPIWLYGAPHTYGIAGLSVSLLALALLGAGWRRSGAFLVALAPAVHTAVGLWLWAVVLAALFMAAVAPSVRVAPRFRVAPSFSSAISFRYALAGLAVTLTSYVVHRALAAPLPAIDAATAARLFDAFVPFWDAHRHPPDFRHAGIWITAGVGVSSALWLIVRRRVLPDGATLLLRAAAIAAVAGLVLAWLAQMPADRPYWFMAAMPGRFVNLAIALAPALLFGAVASLRASSTRDLLLAAIAIALLLAPTGSLWVAIATPPLAAVRVPWTMALGAACVMLAGIGARHRAYGARIGSAEPEPSRAGSGRVLARHLSTMAFAIAAAALAVEGIRASERHTRFRDWTNDRVFFLASRGEGPLLTGGDLFMVQLRTRRPVLLDGGTLDTLPYAIESGPAVDRILRDVYGIDLADPPGDAWGGGRVPNRTSERIWSGFPIEKWRAIRQTYGVTQVMTYGGWQLQLPRAASNGSLTLYTIPD